MTRDPFTLALCDADTAMKGLSEALVRVERLSGRDRSLLRAHVLARLTTITADLAEKAHLNTALGEF